MGQGFCLKYFDLWWTSNYGAGFLSVSSTSISPCQYHSAIALHYFCQDTIDKSGGVFRLSNGVSEVVERWMGRYFTLLFNDEMRF
jgi:hypothetical protein